MFKTIPFYARLALILLMLWLILYGIYVGQTILLPLGFSFLIAILLRPVERTLLRWRVPRVPAILIALLLALVIIAGLVALISTQVASFINDIPQVKSNMLKLWHNVQSWVAGTFNLNPAEQQEMINKASSKSDIGTIAVGTVGAVSASIASIVLVPIYVFLFLYYRDMLLNFIRHLFDEKHKGKVEEVLYETRSVVQYYITGLLAETTGVAILNSAGLLIIGAPYALLLGLVSAILNLVPYIGGIIAIALSALVTYANTGEISKMIGVIIVYMLVQLVDNNVLMPRLVGSRVKLNALISILGVLIGGALCGTGGMFLSIPVIAICKVIFDRIDEMKPWGALLGDDQEAWKILDGKKLRFQRKKESPPPAELPPAEY